MWSRRAVLGVVVAPTWLFGAACSEEPSFEAGDCVMLEERAVDFDLRSVGCEGAVGSMNPDEQVFKIDEVIDGTNAECPALRGFFPVSFSHEPDGVTYCLSMVTG